MTEIRRRLHEAAIHTRTGFIGLFVPIIILIASCSGASQESPGTEARATLPRFADITVEAGLGSFRHERGDAGDLWFPEINGSGAAFIDYDGDGWQDIVIAGGGVWKGSGGSPVEGLWLYRNEGNGTFTLQTQSAGLSGVSNYTYGLAVGDYDNDGDDDLFVTTVTTNLLFRNDGGQFTNVSASAGVAGPVEWSNSAAFVDADRDGWLDLVVTNYVEWSPEKDIPCRFGSDNREDYCTPLAYRGIPPRFYRNKGDGTFVDQSAESGLQASPGKSMGIALLDFDGDGWTDLAISNDGEPDQLFHNQGDGTFRDVGIVMGMALSSRGAPQAGMGIDAGDIDGSGRDAILVGNFANETMSAFQYDGRAMFVDRVRSSGLAAASTPTLSFAVVLFDADLDGSQDVFMANGHISLFADQDDHPIGLKQRPHLFINRGDGAFTDAAPSVPALNDLLLGRGAAVADFDRDGDVDLLVTQNDGRVYLFRNDVRDSGAGPDFLRVELTGTRSNRNGIGAELKLYRDGTSMRRYVRSGSSYLSQSEFGVTFGLGTGASHLDSLVVRWPSGLKQVLVDLEPNQILELVEPDGLAAGG